MGASILIVNHRSRCITEDATSSLYDGYIFGELLRRDTLERILIPSISGEITEPHGGIYLQVRDRVRISIEPDS